MQNEINEVLRLIAPPLENGRKLIKGESKLVLPSHRLYQINTILDVVETKPSDIIIYHTDRRKLESFEKLLNKIPKLEVTQRSIHSYDKLIDIRRFKKLRHLELFRVPLDKVKGLNSLKAQLEFFLCDHCSEVEIITKCGKLQWSELITIKLKNSPINVDEHFFISMPWIQHLDLSFCGLKELDALQYLDNLRFLNLSFNHLEKLPALSAGTCAHLQILLINHNYFQHLQGIEYLINLRGLDVSWNWIAETHNLAPLLKLKFLQWIDMSNTPLSFNKYYRLYLAGAIGSSAAPHQFVIDGRSLSKKEQRYVGCGLGIVRCGKAYYSYDNFPTHEVVQYPSSSKSASKKSLLAKVKNRLNSSKKGSKVREVVIEEYCEIATNDSSRLIPKEEPIPDGAVETVAFLSQDSKESFINPESEIKLLDNLNETSATSEQTADKEHDLVAECNESKQTNITALNNITLGLLEVEIHNSVNQESIDDINISPVQNNDEQNESEEETINQSTPIIEDYESNSLQQSEVFISNEVIQPIDEIKQSTESFIDKETVVEQITIETISDNEIKNESSNNCDQSEEVNSSAESHQDELEYFSATEDKDRTKTISSTDSRQSRETVDSFESQQDDEQVFIRSPLEENLVTNLTLSPIETPVNISPNFPDKTVTKMEVDTDTDSESSGASDTEYEMWPVQKVNNETKESQNILLILLEDELKERSPITGRTVTKWSLNSVQSCVKTKNEPFTVELEFESDKVDKQFRTYIMEFSDAQELMKRLYDILESRPLSAMNQSTFKCLECDSIFVQSVSGKTSLVKCAICSSLKVVLMEEPRPPEVKILPQTKPISHSSSQSSIDRDKDGCGTATSSSTTNISRSAESLDQRQKLGPIPSTGVITPKKYESDIEIISNPSQSSIEVLDEYGRSQGSTPHRKRSSEERQIVAIPQLGTVLEVANAQLSTLTESSSSGSLTESVITTYETHNVINKKPKPEDCLIEESREGSPDTELATNITQGTIDEENGNISQIIRSDQNEIYNYNDFTQVDVRVKLFLYQSIFHDENEELLLLVKCHLWKTGDLDYDACVVFSTTKLYFLYHSYTNFKEETCDWLTLNDTIVLKEIKQVSPIIWNQGAIVNVNQITYLILLLDKERTDHFFRFLEGLSIKEIKIKNNVNSKIEMSLQQAVLTSNVSHNAVDPSIVSFSICLKLCINKDDEEIIMRLRGLVITGSEFHVVPGDLRWLCSEKIAVPKILISQPISTLIEVEKSDKSLKLHFLDEGEALEEIWTLKLATNGQVSSIIDSIKTSWEAIFLSPLEITIK